MSSPQALKTVDKGAQDIVYKDKGSKFLGFAKHVDNAEKAMAFFELLRKQHPGANHCCYAYRLGSEGQDVRANDDGEPTHSAGTPILGQIQSYELTNTALAVIRYFGGTKLGVGGLVKAYKATAQLTLDACRFKVEVVYQRAQLKFYYPDIGTVMHWLKQEQYTILEQDLDQNCTIEFNLPAIQIQQAANFWNSRQDILFEILEADRGQ